MLETKIPLWALIIIEAHQNTFKMAAINFLPETELAPSDPSDLPCLFVGKLEHIKAAGYNGVAKFLGDKVDQKVICFNNCNALRCIVITRTTHSWSDLMQQLFYCMYANVFVQMCIYGVTQQVYVNF